MKCASEDKLKTNFLRAPIWSDQIKCFGQHRFRGNDVPGPFFQLGNTIIVQLSSRSTRATNAPVSNKSSSSTAQPAIQVIAVPLA